MRYALLKILLTLLLITGDIVPALAMDDCQQGTDECVAIGKWTLGLALGAGVRTNPLIDGEDIPLVLIPQISYYGKRLFIENLDIGFTIKETSANTFSLIASPEYDRVFFYRYDLQNLFVITPTDGGPISFENIHFDCVNPGSCGSNAQYTVTHYPQRSRAVTYLAGFEWTFQAALFSGQTDLLHEMTGRDDGNEIRVALKFPLHKTRNKLYLDIGATWKSAEIVNYYYGDRGLYEGASSLDPFIKLSYSRTLNKNWCLIAFVHYEKLGNGITQSPIVTRNHVDTGFAGAQYEF